MKKNLNTDYRLNHEIMLALFFIGVPTAVWTVASKNLGECSVMGMIQKTIYCFNWHMKWRKSF